MTFELQAALADEVALVLGGLIDSPADASPSSAPATPGPRWVATLEGVPASRGTATVEFDVASASAITALTMGLTGAVPDKAIADTLRELLAQALSALTQKPDVHGVVLRVTSVQAAEASSAGQAPGMRFTIAAAKLEAPVSLEVAGSIDLSAAPAGAATHEASMPVHAVGDPDAASRIDVILDIDLPLVVRFGRTEMPLRTLARMGPGTLIDLGRNADDPVEVLVSNRVVARGEVVIVSGNYGVRVTDVVSPRERVRSMEA
jgi:flagellar motor switch protein FliN/FliY